MVLKPKQIRLFTTLNTELLKFAEPELKAYLPSPPKGKSKEEVVQRIIAIRDALQQHPRVIDKFMRQNPASLTAEQLALVASWKDARAGWFYVVRHLQRHSIFMAAEEDYSPTQDVYAVSAISERFSEVVGESLPVLVRTALLPFEGKILFDGLLQFWPCDLGNEVRRMVMGCYEYIRKTTGVIKTIGPETGKTTVARRRRKRMSE